MLAAGQLQGNLHYNQVMDLCNLCTCSLMSCLDVLSFGGIEWHFSCRGPLTSHLRGDTLASWRPPMLQKLKVAFFSLPSRQFSLLVLLDLAILANSRSAGKLFVAGKRPGQS